MVNIDKEKYTLFFDENKKLLNENKFQELYSNYKPFFKKHFNGDGSWTATVTFILLSTGINPIDYFVNIIPPFYGYELNSPRYDISKFNPSITIPKNIEFIGESAFDHCFYKKFHILNKNIKFDFDSFTNLKSITIIYPDTISNFRETIKDSYREFTDVFANSSGKIICLDGEIDIKHEIT